MNQHLQSILNIIQHDERLTVEEKNDIAKSLKEADKELEITTLKLDRAEKAERTAAILLEETIEELAQKRKAVEAQNRSIEIEASLERVRSMAMGMRKPVDLLSICEVIFTELHTLGFSELRNAMINIHDDDKRSFLNYDFSDAIGPTVTTIFYDGHPATEKLVQQIKSSNDAFAEVVIHGSELDEWREYRKRMGEKDDPRLYNIAALSYYFYSIGNGAIGISTYNSITEEKRNVLKRFRNAFDFAYRRYTDVTQAEAQAREAKIETALERIRSKTMAMHHSIELREVVANMHEQLQYLDIKYGACTIIIMDKESGDMEHWVGGFAQKIYPESYRVNYFSHPFYDMQLAHWKNGEKYTVLELSGEMKRSYDEFMFTKTDFRNFPEQEKKWMRELESVVFSVAYMHHGALTWGPEALSEDHSIILQRFAKVFEQTYTRFLDLQKAEAQAREAQIEVSLERVRSKAMAMQKSEDLTGAVATVFEELDKLNLGMLRCGIGILDKLKCSADVWTTTKSLKGTIVHLSGNEPMNIHPLLQGAFNAWLNQEEYYSYVLQGEDLNGFYKAVADTNFQLPESESLIAETRELKQYYFATTFQSGGLYAFRETAFPGEAKTVMKRFADVFNFTYTRFNDLKYAEAQAREAKIEVALERIRAKALAMQTPNDLLDVANVLRGQMGNLGQPELESSIVHIYNDDSPTFEAWYAYCPPNHSPDQIITDVANVPKDSSLWAREVIEKYKSADTEYTIEASGQKLTEWYKVLEKIAPVTVEYDDSGQPVVPGILYYHFSNFSGGSLLMISNQAPSREARELQKRAAIVFDLAYTRFLDLQKAEAQAKEAQIEAALERVRAKAMAMHNSEDLTETIQVFYQQMGLLNLMPRRCGVGLFDKETHSADLIGMIISEQGEAKEIAGKLKLAGHPVLKNVYEHWLSEKEYHPVLRGNEIKDYYQFIGSRISFQNYPDDAVQFGYFFFFPEGAVYGWTEKELAEDELKIYRRFTSVLSLTYKRYKDLKQAEAQTRQAQIETAMEKVRARALAMQKPEELIEVAQVLRKEMGLLGVEELETSSIYILDEASGKTECWYAIKDNREPENKLAADHMIMQLPETWVGRQMLEFYKSDEKQISIPMQGAYRKEWIEYCSKQSQVFEGFYGENIPERTYHLNKFSNGYIGAASPGNISAESWELLQRATSVFSLAYTRFSDLQQAETQAKEAIKASSLDRIRAEIASMRTTDDLQRITPSVWKELTVLGVPFFRCGVFIINEKEEKAHIYLSTPDGKPLAVLHLDFDSSGVIRNAAEHWRIQKVYTEHWNRAQFVTWVKSLIGQGQIEAADTYQAGDEPPESLTLQFVPFAQGMLYVGSAEALTEGRIESVHALADAFSVAYARYDDFKKLEDAKGTVEKTLAELKATQSQLIQAEKMASLGELTAGIAHEIQNPLNFVNNFSEVSNELIVEMNEELNKGEIDEAKMIASDIQQNLEKINHHGKRADAIVKGMLQHSRSSSGIKESTDINKLVDEYLRLAYHGLRAKDNSFNATLKTVYDDNIGKINIIPQDIGRVVLNLITNAFYAIAEKKKQQPGGYEPTFSVTTKKIGGKIEICVKDNGNGIPEKVLGKIFQPFFTTKPTGQGTGLGLSLSYDIVKAHGGELNVKTNEGEGAEFRIQLPIN